MPIVAYHNYTSYPCYALNFVHWSASIGDKVVAACCGCRTDMCVLTVTHSYHCQNLMISRCLYKVIFCQFSGSSKMKILLLTEAKLWLTFLLPHSWPGVKTTQMWRFNYGLKFFMHFSFKQIPQKGDTALQSITNGKILSTALNITLSHVIFFFYLHFYYSSTSIVVQIYSRYMNDNFTPFPLITRINQVFRPLWPNIIFELVNKCYGCLKTLKVALSSENTGKNKGIWFWERNWKPERIYFYNTIFHFLIRLSMES